MKTSAVLLLLIMMLCACGREQPSPIVRPGTGTDPSGPSENNPATMPEPCFSPDNITEIATDAEDLEIHIILYREAGYKTAAQTYALELTDGRDFAELDHEATFAQGAKTATAALRVAPSKMGRDMRRAVVKISKYDKSLTLTFTRRSGGWTVSSPLLFFDGTTFKAMTTETRTYSGTTEWRITGNEFVRQFCIKDGDVSVTPVGDVVDSKAYGQTELYPAAASESFHTEAYTVLNVCHVSADGLSAPMCEYFFQLPEDGVRYAVANICDGWLLPVLAINSQMLSPAENIWQAPAKIDRQNLTIYGPYHSTSPLSTLNAAPLSSAWHIGLNDTKAIIAPQDAGFANNLVFNFNLLIAAEGTVKDRTITFTTPLHNCNPDGTYHPTVDQHWGTVLPTIIEIVPFD